MLRVKPIIYLFPILLCCAIPAEAAGKSERLDSTALPLGDGKISAEPMRGHVYSCQSHFRGGVAHRDGDWLGSDSWDTTHKIHVQGDVRWPNASISVSPSDGVRRIVGNGLPTGHGTGIFPVRESDPAYQIDRNPNRIEPQQIVLNLPLQPEPAEQASCVPMGMIGITTGGVAIFNALDDAGRDAVAHEVQDQCGGHPQMQGQYHYHGPSPCDAPANGNNKLVGYALDGFGIYSGYDENGRELTNADLDECHGRTGRIQWDGKEVEMYHYVLTREYPYTVGCFRGRPVSANRQREQNPEQAGFGHGRPPQQAVAACAGQAPGTSCRFESPHGDVTGSCRELADATVCVPDRPPRMRPR